MARHCSSVTVVPCAIGAVGSNFTGDTAGDAGGTGDAEGTCSAGGASGAGDAVVDFIEVEAAAAASDDLAASGPSVALSGASIVTAVLDSYLPS